MPSFVEIYGIKYYGKINTRSNGARFMFEGFIYDVKTTLLFNSPDEFRDKVYERIPEHIKEEFEEKVPSRVTLVEDRVAQLEAKVEINITNHKVHSNELVTKLIDTKISTLETNVNTRFETVESKVDTHTEELELLRKLVLKHEDTISQLQENDRIQSLEIQSLKDHNVIQDRKIVTLETKVSKLESENEDRAREIQYINDNQNKRVSEGVNAIKKTMVNFEKMYTEDHKMLVQIADIFGIEEGYSVKLNQIENLIEEYNTKLDDLYEKSKLNDKNIRTLDKRTIRQQEEIQENREEMLYTYQERKARELERLKEVVEKMRQVSDTN